MDLGTIIGFFMAFGLVVFGMTMGEAGNGPMDRLLTFLDIPSILIVFGGTLGATMINCPLGGITSLGKIVKNAFFAKPINTAAVVDEFMDYANRARREGILALEGAIRGIPDNYLRKGLQLTVDGMEPQIIQDIMEAEISNLEGRHSNSIAIVNALATYAPSLGMIGTVIGLVQMLKTLDDPSSIGPAMAVALITTFYGALLANLVFIPLAGKLRTRSAEEVHLMEMQMEGVLAIAKGENPRLIQEKLSSFQPPNQRKAT